MVRFAFDSGEGFEGPVSPRWYASRGLITLSSPGRPVGGKLLFHLNGFVEKPFQQSMDFLCPVSQTPPRISSMFGSSDWSGNATSTQIRAAYEYIHEFAINLIMHNPLDRPGPDRELNIRRNVPEGPQDDRT